jgi:hypothetical protein
MPIGSCGTDRFGPLRQRRVVLIIPPQIPGDSKDPYQDGATTSQR